MKIKKIIFALSFLFGSLLVLSSKTTTVNADIGPKASLTINFENMSSNEECYCTLLSEHKSTGPYSVYDEESGYQERTGLSPDIWQKFVDYEDQDNFYFLQIGQQINISKQFTWSYYPPNTFKILLYYPSIDTFISSGIYSRYAFDTYYTVDMDGINIESITYNETLSNNQRIEAYKSYEYGKEIISLVIRIVLTIGIELLVALAFGIKKRKEISLLLIVNVITQIILNLMMSFEIYLNGFLSMLSMYVFVELLVVTIEAFIYSKYMRKISEENRSKSYYILYAISANVISFALGLVLASYIPNIF